MKESKPDSFERLRHIMESIYKIEEFTNATSEKEFINDKLLSSAVLFHFSVIGEAVIFIDSEILESYDYPWHKVRAFRNLISHEYFNIKLEAVWAIIFTDLPELKEVISKILKNEF